MRKYKPIHQHLAALKLQQWHATFDEIECILQDRLPRSAKTYPAWWANEKSGSHVQAASWLEAGWQTRDVNIEKQSLIFERIENSRRASAKEKKQREIIWSNAGASEKARWQTTTLVDQKWRRVGQIELDRKGAPVFPKCPNAPTVYLLHVPSKSKPETYVGETDNLARRLQHYRTPGPTQKTSQRLRQFLVETLERDKPVELHVLGEDTQIRTRNNDRPANMADKVERHLLEASAIVGFREANHKLLNL